MSWKSVLARVDKTQPAGELVLLRPVSLDQLAATLRKAEGEVVIWEAAQQRLDSEYQDETTKIQADLKASQEKVAAAQAALIEAHYQSGTGSIFKSEIERVASCRK